MKAVALKRFSFSSDGVSVTEVSPGDVVDVPDDLFPGLRSERFVDPQGFVEHPAPAPIAPPPRPMAEQAPTGAMHVRHLGRGKYAVFRGETRLTHNPLEKHEADAAMADLAAAQTE